MTARRSTSINPFVTPRARRALPRSACPYCGRKFTPTRAWHRYDSPKCRYAAWVAGMRERVRAEVLAELGRPPKAAA